MDNSFTPKSQEEGRLNFTKMEYAENVDLYKFPGVRILVDHTGKNYKELPELLFGTYDTETMQGSMNKPELKREGIDMSLVAECIQRVLNESGIRKFWIYPYGGDSSEEKNREKARFRLFSRYTNLTPDEEKHGYILEV